MKIRLLLFTFAAGIIIGFSLSSFWVFQALETRSASIEHAPLRSAKLQIAQDEYPADEDNNVDFEERGSDQPGFLRSTPQNVNRPDIPDLYAKEPSQPLKTDSASPAKYGNAKPSNGLVSTSSRRQNLRDLSDEDYWARLPALKAALDRYAKLHREMTTDSGSTAPKKYIHLTPGGQLANRVLPTVSTLLMGLLTDRAVLVSFDYYASWSDLFEKAPIDLTAQGAGWSGAMIDLADGNPGIEYVNKLMCSDLSETFQDDSIRIVSNQYFAPYFVHNEHYKEILEEWFPDGDIFGPLSRWLLKPNADVQKRRLEYREQHFKDKFVVGLQVRTGGDFTDAKFLEPEWRKLVACAEDLYRQRMRERGVTNPDMDRLLFFVATDIGWSRENARNVMGDRALFYGDEFLFSNTPLGCQHAYLDILLLSDSDELFITPWSTFGYMAAALSHKPAHMLTDVQDEDTLPSPESDHQPFYMGVPMHSDKRTGCVELPTYQPCFHLFARWGLTQATCFSPDIIRKEFRGGRYC